jgi:hypothetical protein
MIEPTHFFSSRFQRHRGPSGPATSCSMGVPGAGRRW